MEYCICSVKFELQDHILRAEVWAHKTNLSSPLLIAVPVPSQYSTQSCVCMRGIIFHLYFYDFRLHFGTVLMVCVFFPIILL